MGVEPGGEIGPRVILVLKTKFVLQPDQVTPGQAEQFPLPFFALDDIFMELVMKLSKKGPDKFTCAGPG